MYGAGDGTRTHMTGLEGQGSAVELHPQLSGHSDSNRESLAPKASMLAVTPCPELGL